MNRTVSVLSILVLAAVAGFWAGCVKAKGRAAQAKPAAKAAAVDISALPVFLRYPGAKAIEKMELSLSDSKGTTWTLVTSDPKATVAEWYRTSVQNERWNKSPEMEAGRSAMLEWEKPDKKETIKLLIYEKDGKTNISLTHGLK